VLHYRAHCDFTDLCVLDNESSLSSVRCSETEREKELCQQLKQANDKLRQAEDRERQLQMELDKTKHGISERQLQQQESDDTKQSDRESNILF